ncbi:MAG: hypothetical protein FP833_12270 [Atribacteria sp.]|nr:hypothetical protein [Candidatus Atribacteria bacterium]
MTSYNFINLEDFVDMLLEERHRTFIVHSEPMSGKSKYAKRFAKKIGGKYLDLLEQFREDRNLKNSIDTFSIKELEILLVEEAKDTNLLIVDNIEFLLNTWGEDRYDLLFRLIKEKWNSFYSSYEATLGIFLISNCKIMNMKLKTNKDKSRIFHLQELESL